MVSGNLECLKSIVIIALHRIELHYRPDAPGRDGQTMVSFYVIDKHQYQADLMTVYITLFPHNGFDHIGWA